MKSKYLNIIITFLLLTGCSITCFSQSEFQPSNVNEKFFEANNLYNDSKYEQSIQVYLQILDSGVHSPELYFNIGNAYYRLNDIANSILYYEKSLKLDSSDNEVVNNLNMVKNALIDDIAVVPPSFIDEQLNKISNLLDYSLWGIVLILLSFIFLLFFIIYFFSIKPIIKRTAFTSLFFIIIMIALTAWISINTYEKNHLEKYAIIFSTKIEIKADPNERSENLLTLHLGTKVRIIDNFKDEWVKIKLVNGQEGWIKNNQIKII